MNPIKSFQPTVGAHVHDALNNVWITLKAEHVADMERGIRQYGRESGIENWDGFILDGWLPPEATPPETIRTPGPGANSQLDAIRVALRAHAMSDYMLMPEQVEAIMSEARAEAVEGVIELAKETVASADARDRFVAQLRAARARRSTAHARQGRRDRPPDHPTGEYPSWAPEDIEALISGARAEVVRQAAELVTQAVLATDTRDRLLARLRQFQASDSRDAPPASSP